MDRTKEHRIEVKHAGVDERHSSELGSCGEESLCPCRLCCDPCVILFCFCCGRRNKLSCLFCCRNFNYALYRLKKILCIIFAIPKAILDFIKHVICCLGLLLLLLALAALVIFLLRTFCDQVVSLIDFLFFTGGSSIFPFRAYGYAVSNAYDYSASKGIPYNDLIFLWNESVPNISMFVKSLLDMLSQMHDALFTQTTTEYDVETTILLLSQRVGFIYEFIFGMAKAFLEADVNQLQNLATISNQLTTSLINDQMAVSKCLSVYPQLGFQCLLVSSVLYGSTIPQQNLPVYETVVYRGNYYNLIPQGRKLMSVNVEPSDQNMAYQEYVPNNSGQISLMTSMLSYICSTSSMEAYKICKNVKRAETVDLGGESLVRVLLKFALFDLHRDTLKKYLRPSDVVYSGEFQKVFSAIKTLHSHPQIGMYASLKVEDNRMSTDYGQWLLGKGFGDDPVGISGIADSLSNPRGNNGKRNLKIALYPPIVGCFNYIPPDPLCILQGFLPLPFSTTGVWNTIVTAIDNFSCDCSALGYSDLPFFLVLPIFTNTWLIIKTIISGIFSIPVFSSLISAITIPSWIQNVFFLDVPGTPLTADQVICAILHLDYAIEFLMALLILWALLAAILHAICKIIECCAQLRILREVMILSNDGIINPKKINIIEQEILEENRRNERSTRVSEVITETSVEKNPNAKKTALDRKAEAEQKQFEKYKNSSTPVDPMDLESGLQAISAHYPGRKPRKQEHPKDLKLVIQSIKRSFGRPLTREDISNCVYAYYQVMDTKLYLSRAQIREISPALVLYRQKNAIVPKYTKIVRGTRSHWFVKLAMNMRSNHQTMKKLVDMSLMNLGTND